MLIINGLELYECHPSSTSSSETIKILLSLFPRLGVQNKLASDNGPKFTSDKFKEFMRKCGILHIKTAPCYPQTNGQVERFVQILKNMHKGLTMTKA